MKRVFIIILFLLTGSAAPAAAIPKEVTGSFNAGNSLYQEGNYAEAIKRYQQCISSGYVSGALYYNLGNCYFKLGNLGKTLLYYRRAERLLPRDPELKSNLSYVSSLVADKISEPQPNWFLNKIDYFINLLSLKSWIYLAVLIWLIIILGGMLAVFIRVFRKFYKHILFLGSVLLLVALYSIFIQYKLSITPKGIILAEAAPVYYGPSEGDVEAFILHEGTEVMVKQQQQDWYQIQLIDGKSGWVSAASLEII